MFNSDSFVEQVVKNGKHSKYFGLKILLSILTVMAGLVIMYYFGPGLLGLFVAPIIIIIGIYLFFLVLSYRELEYEYTLTNGSIEIAGVYKKSKRKEFFHFDFDQVDMIVPADSKRIENEKYDRKSYFGSKQGNDNQIAMLVEIKKHRELIIIEPNERTLAHIKLYARTKCSDI